MNIPSWVICDVFFRVAKMPEYAEKAAMRELKRLRKITPQMPEHAMIRLGKK